VKKHIISINALRKDGWRLIENRNFNSTHLVKDNCRITFIEKENNLHYLKAIEVSVGVNNIAIQTPGNLPTGSTEEDGENENLANPNNRLKNIDVNVFHDLHGHNGMSRMQAKAKVLGMYLSGKFHCDACSTVKAKSLAIQRKTNDPAKQPNEQMFLDTTGPFKVRIGQRGRLSNLFLFGLSDKYSSKMLFGFGSEKSDIIHMFEDAYQVCNGKNLPIQNVTMDNGGENLAVATFCRHNNIRFKFTPPDTPKLNGVIERGLAIRLEKAKVLMKNANLNITTQSNKIILMEAIKTAAFLYDECPQMNKSQSPNELWYGSDYKQRVKPQHYVQFGRIGFVTNKRTYIKKNENKGAAMMMVGYALDSPSGTYRFYNPRTNALVESNSVTWKEFSRFEDDSLSNFKNAQAGGIVRGENYDLNNENDVTFYIFYIK